MRISDWSSDVCSSDLQWSKTITSRPSQQRIEPARGVERRKIVAATDLAAVDEYLRHGAATARPRDHRADAGAVPSHVDLPIGCALAVEQRLRTRALGAEKSERKSTRLNSSNKC